jgi:hypothetical protein
MSRSRILALAIAGAVASLAALTKIAPMPASAAGPSVQIVKPATVCITSQGARKCYTPPANDPPFNLDPKATIVTIAPGRQLVLFSAIASAGGSGSQMALALLENANGNLADRLPFQLSLKEDGAFNFWQDAAVPNALIFVTAEFIWGSDECHFCAHKFTVNTYTYDSQVGRYSLRDKYTTANKYTSPASVLSAEKQRIHLRLQKNNR